MGEPIELVAKGAGRRRWSVEEKLRIVAETQAPGATVREVARRHDVNANLLYTWRRMSEGRPARPAGAQLVPVTIVEPAPVAVARPASGAMIEIALPGGARLKFGAAVCVERLAEVLAILRR